MMWCQTPVTVKRLHSKTEEVGAVDLLINEMEYMGCVSVENLQVFNVFLTTRKWGTLVSITENTGVT